MTEAKMRQVALDIVQLPTYKEVIEKNQISKTTFHNLRKNPKFRQILIQTQAEAWEKAINVALRGAEMSVACLMDFVKDSKATPATRIRAAKAVLEMGAEYYDNTRILARIEELENLYDSDPSCWDE